MYNIYLLYEVTANLENDICALLIFLLCYVKVIDVKKKLILVKITNFIS